MHRYVLLLRLIDYETTTFRWCQNQDRGMCRTYLRPAYRPPMTNWDRSDFGSHENGSRLPLSIPDPSLEADPIDPYTEVISTDCSARVG
jgi:hypothetical protein